MVTTTPDATSPLRRPLSLDEYERGLLSGDRTILGRAITLVESRKHEDHNLAQQLLQRILPRTGNSHRIGITGMPGAGKSTLMETLGSRLTANGHKIAVLAVDPSSARTGGSILGDKSRMTRLSADPNAFVRPSPSAGIAGGVNRASADAISLCEAAGFDLVFVETVGVGQSETMVADMVDFFMMLILPGGGDELQGIKKGVIEIADMVVVNKADGEQESVARRTASDYRAAIHLLQPAHPDWTPPVITCSALHDQGLDALWDKIKDHQRVMRQNGIFEDKRAQQRGQRLWSLLEDRLMRSVTGNPGIMSEAQTLEAQVRQGELTPLQAVEMLLTRLGHSI